MVTGVLNGREYALEEHEVVRTLAHVEPEPVRDHYVVIEGRRFPPKQVLSVVLGLDRADFTTYQARTILRRLGLIAGRRGEEPAVPPPQPAAIRLWEARRPTRPDGSERGSAEALRPYVGQWVAVVAGEVVAAGASPRDVLRALERERVTAESMFRVPLDPARDVLGG